MDDVNNYVLESSRHSFVCVFMFLYKMKDRLQFYHFMIGICPQCKFFYFVYHDTCFASRPSRECLTVEGGNHSPAKSHATRV